MLGSAYNGYLLVPGAMDDALCTEARRLMWTLAHTHGTLLGLVHLAFSATACSPAP